MTHWRLTFSPMPSSTVPVEVRIRRLLKFALRSCDLKCIEHEEINEQGDDKSGESKKPVVY